MPDVIDQRPPVAVGHVRLPCGDVAAAARWLETVGLRPIVQMDDLAVLELRGGTDIGDGQPDMAAGARRPLIADIGHGFLPEMVSVTKSSELSPANYRTRRVTPLSSIMAATKRENERALSL